MKVVKPPFRRLGWKVPMVGVAALVAVAGSTSVLYPASAHSLANARQSIFIDDIALPLTDSFAPPFKNGVDAAASNLGVKVNYLADDESNFATTSVDNLNVAIAQHPSAIVDSDCVPSASDPLIKKAVKEGIPVMIVTCGLLSWQADGAIGYVGNDPYATGQMAAEQLASRGSKNAICVENVPDNPYQISICAAMAKEMKALGKTATAFGLVTADSENPAAVTSAVGAYLHSHKTVDGIFALNAVDGTAALAAVQTAKLQGKIPVGSLELSKIALQDVKNGSIAFLISEQQYLEGYLVVLFAYDYVKYGMVPTEVVATGPSLIDKQNIDKVSSLADQYPGILGAA
jgi:simple sugar transport system substrate-binding protein